MLSAHSVASPGDNKVRKEFMRFHGNYCGPNWSAGVHQPSVDSDMPAIDEFDNSCKIHDRAFARGEDVRQANKAFVERNGFASFKQGLATTAVMVTQYGQKRFRGSADHKTNMTKLRGSKAKQLSNTTRQGNDVVKGAPSAIATRRTGQAAIVRNRPNGISVKHRTFLTPISCEVNFDAEKFSVNPGMASTFPWLAKIAARYDKYRFRRLRFEYRSVVATSSPGVIMMSFDYDAADAVPNSKLQQAQTIPNAENNVWMNNDLNVPCDSNWRFVRQGDVSNTDIKTYDFGNLVVSSLYGSGLIGGELYVEYEVEFEKPTEPAPLSQQIRSTTPTVADPLTGATSEGPAQAFSIYNNNSIQCKVPGEYFIAYDLTGSSISGSNYCTTDGSVAGLAKNVGLGDTTGFSMQVVRVTRGDLVYFASKFPAVAITQATIRITECDYETMT